MVVVLHVHVVADAQSHDNPSNFKVARQSIDNIWESTAKPKLPVNCTALKARGLLSCLQMKITSSE